jgi:hypothetical protein
MAYYRYKKHSVATNGGKKCKTNPKKKINTEE